MPLWLGLLWLTSCAGVRSEAPAVVNACAAVPLARYTTAQQRRVADEMDAAPAGAGWPGFMADYGRLRAAVRACQGIGA